MDECRSDGPEDADRRVTTAWAAALVALVAFTFLPALGGQLLSDDHVLVRDASVALAEGSASAYLSTPLFRDEGTGAAVDPAYTRLHRPTVKALLLAGQALGGSPLVLHALALVVHLLAAYLAFRVAARSLHSPALAFVVAGVFAVHVTRIEAVAWISGMSDTAMLALVLLAAELAPRTFRGKSALVGFVAALAMGAKEPAFVLAPAMVALNTAGAVRVKGRAALPALVGVVAVGAVSLWVTRHGAPVPVDLDVARTLGVLGMSVDRFVLPWPPTLLPYPVAFDPSGAARIPVEYVALGAALVLVSVLVGVRARTSSVARDVAFMLLLALVALAPALGLVERKSDSWLADRFLYAPLFFVMLAAGHAVTAASHGTRRAAVAVGLLVVAASVFSTHRGVRVYADDATLLRHEFALHPDDPRFCGMNSRALAAGGRMGEAIDELERCAGLAAAQHRRELELSMRASALAMRVFTVPPVDSPEVRRLHAALVSLRDEGTLPTAFGSDAPTRTLDRREREALARRADILHVPIAVLEVRMRAFDDAERSARVATEVAPANPDAWMTLLTALARAHRFRDAKADLERARVALRDPPYLMAFASVLARAEAIDLTRDDGRSDAERDADVARALGDVTAPDVAPDSAPRVTSP